MLAFVRWGAWVLLFTSLFTGFISRVQAQTDYAKRSGFENQVLATCKLVEENCKTTTQLKESDLGSLPLGIAPQGCNGTTIVVVDSASWGDRRGGRPSGWLFSAYASVIIPGTSKPIAFAAKNIGFNGGVLSGSSQIKLILVSPQSIPINEHLTLELPADGHNFVEFDCDGFKAVNLKGNFVFSDGLLQPDTDRVKGAKNVTASFEIHTADLNNLMATVNITPFKIRGIQELSFEVHQAVVDYSDLVNPAAFIFPQGYQQTYGENLSLWRGFYLKDLTVRVKGLSDSTSSKKSFAIQAQNLLIDDMGVSGQFTASNLLPLQEGSADGWPFSVDKLSLTLQLNRLTGGLMEGWMGVPFLGPEPLGYSAMVEQEDNHLNYRFAVALADTAVFRTPFSSTIQLYKGSIIALEKRGNGRLIPSALLQGEISVGGKIAAKGIRFENLGLTSVKPYVISGDFSTVGKGLAKGLGGFPLQINDVGLKVASGQAALSMGVTLNFMNGEDKPFGASTRIDMLAAMEEKSTTVSSVDGPSYTVKNQVWQFQKMKVSDVTIDCKTQAFTLNGKLSLYDQDPVYGTGFGGNIAFSIKKVLEKGVKVNAYFGSKEDFRYWHVDAYVPVGQFPVVPPVLFLTGLQGGASYKMVRQKPLLPDFTKMDKASQIDSVSKEQTHRVYVPDSQAGMGFMAGVTMVVGNESAINGDLMLEVMFNQGGGLKYVHFDGTAFFLTSIKMRGRMVDGKAATGPVFAQMNMLFDNDNHVFHANLKTYINVASVLTGVGANGLVGEAVVHVDRQNWYTYIGRPSAMFGVNVMGLATARTYFMVGTKIENLPLPPSEVREIFGNIDLRLMRDDQASGDGKGFAAGLHFRMGFDSKEKFMPFYIMMTVGAGADIMLRNYGNAECLGREGKVGINGWYASGQAYVFLVGKVGLRVGGKSFDIVSLGLAALLQAKLPNPTWMRGMLAGRYAVLGGLVKGSFNIKFELGEECQMKQAGSEVKDIVVIADIKPAEGGTDVNVFSAPQVAFNAAVGQDFNMMDRQDQLQAYRIVLDDFTLTKDGTNIPGTLQWNGSKDVALLKTAEILPPQSKLSVAVKIHWEKKSGNGIWQAVRDNDNTVIYETKTAQFTTGTAPNFIPDENVTYSYPIKYQHNLYLDESGSGYVKLNYGQEYLFLPSDETTTWDYVARFKDNRGKVSEVPLTYQVAEAKVNFSFPALEKQGIYTMTFIKRPRSGEAIDHNLQRKEVRVDAGEGNEMTTRANTLEGTVAQNVEKELYASAFRASQFATFSEKWTSMGKGQDAFDVAKGNLAVIGKRLSVNESFDEFELLGNEGVAPLIQVSASPETPWLKNIISPLLYDSYPYEKEIMLSWRNPAVLGLKPLKGVKLTNSMDHFKLTEGQVIAGKVPTTKGTVLMGYYLSYYAFWDYTDLLNQASAKYLDNWAKRPEGVKRLMADKGYTDLLEGRYPVDVTYTLPGANLPTFTTQMSIQF
jgi:hypothetical protein